MPAHTETAVQNNPTGCSFYPAKNRSDGAARRLGALNKKLDRCPVPWDVNEPCIVHFYDILMQTGDPEANAYWLMMARLAELALLCAGHYADNCEFTAAGDLLVTPRQTNVHLKGDRRSIVKQRHSRLSDQFRPPHMPRVVFMGWFRRHASLHIDQPAILPHLLEQMTRSGRLAPAYLTAVRRRMARIADTIGFLCAGAISNAADLYTDTRNGSSQPERFVADHLCRFKRDRFDRLGTDIGRTLQHPAYVSDFIHAPANRRAKASKARLPRAIRPIPI